MLYGIFVEKSPESYMIDRPQAYVINPNRHLYILETEQQDNIEFINRAEFRWKFKDKDETFIMRPLSVNYLYVETSGYDKVEL